MCSNLKIWELESRVSVKPQLPSPPSFDLTTWNYWSLWIVWKTIFQHCMNFHHAFPWFLSPVDLPQQNTQWWSTSDFEETPYKQDYESQGWIFLAAISSFAILCRWACLGMSIPELQEELSQENKKLMLPECFKGGYSLHLANKQKATNCSWSRKN